MKYLDFATISRINSFLDSVDVGDLIVKGDLEAYSCEHAPAAYPAEALPPGRAAAIACHSALGLRGQQQRRRAAPGDCPGLPCQHLHAYALPP